MFISRTSEGRICAIGPDKEIQERYDDSQFDSIVDATGQCLVPGKTSTHEAMSLYLIWSSDTQAFTNTIRLYLACEDRVL